MSASKPPKTPAVRSPTTQLPLQTEPQMPKNAPVSIMPSRPMFTTPERSEKMPPIAANASGVAKRSIDASTPAVRMLSSVSASLPWSQIALAVPAMPSPIAHQPSLRSPRGTAAIPHATAMKPAASGQPISWVVHGGSASQKASTPKPIPSIPIERASVARCRPLAREPVGAPAVTAEAPAERADASGRASLHARCR